MAKKLYSSRDYSDVAFHYGGTGTILAGASALLSWPIVFGGAVLMSSLMVWNRSRGAKEVFEKKLKRHPKSHKYSPNLQKMVDDLFEASGLETDKVQVYDFRLAPYTDISGTNQNETAKDEIREGLSSAALVHNAAAFNMGKPIIMISEPLLHLLTDKEEKAVLAHEFAHAAANHHYVTLPTEIASRVIRTVNLVSVGLTVMVAGVTGVLTSVAGALLAVGLSHRVKFSKKTKADQPQQTNEETEDKEEISIKGLFAGAVTGVGVLSYFQPVFVPVMAGVFGMNVLSGLLQKSFSRCQEYQADRGAITLGGDPLGLITALRKITIVSRGEEEERRLLLEEEDWIDTAVEYAATHPRLNKRIEKLADMAREQGASEQAIYEAMHGRLNVDGAKEVPSVVVNTVANRLVNTPQPRLEKYCSKMLNFG